MESLLRSVAAISISGVVVWACMWDAGAKLAERQYYARGAEIERRLSPDSQYTAAVYAQRVGNEPQSIGPALTVLLMAHQTEEAERLRRFFGYCNVRRFLGQDDACTRETVRSAVGPRGGVLGPEFWTTEWPVTGRIASQVTRALSLSLASERLMRQATQFNTEFWKNNNYAGPGLVLHHGGGIDAYLFVVTRNQTPWEITESQATLEVPSPAGAPLVFECRNPGFWDNGYIGGAIAPGAQTVEACMLPSGPKHDDLLGAIHETQRHDSISVRVQSLDLENPYVHVTADHDGPTALFKVSPDNRGFEAFGGSRAFTDVKTVSCHETGVCRSQYQAAALAIYNFSRQRAALMAVIVGLLLGVSFGALSQRSLLLGSTLMAVPLAAAAAFIGYLIYSLSTGPSGGFGGLAIIGLIGLYVTLLVPFVGGFFGGMALVRLLRGLPEPSP